jgi:RNA polymerase sigma-70 factor (ECF subfamily)
MPFDDIYLEYYQRCFLFAKSYLQDEMLSKDIASEAMITLWTTMKTEEVKNVRSFLMTVVKNQALNHLRNEHLRMEARESILADELYELDFRIASNRLFSEEIVEIVNRTLGELPEKTRKAFMMSRYQNKSVKEIAGLLDVTVKGADYHIGKALQALRKSLKDYLSSFLFF